MNEPHDVSDALLNKLAAARTKLILDKPFLGALVLRLPMVAADKGWCPTTATDARAFYYNPEYIDSLSFEQTQFMLAHEALHCALSHFARRQHRVKHRWDLACDFAINPILIDDGLKPPPDSLFMEEYRDMTAEEIYPLLEDNDEMDTLDQHLYDQDESEGEEDNHSDIEQKVKSSKGQSPSEDANQNNQQDKQTESGNPQPNAESKNQSSGGTEIEERDNAKPRPLGQQEKENLDTQWQQRLAGAAQQARQSGKMGEALERLITHLQQSKVPWRTLLAQFMVQTARDDFSYQRPSRREGNAILPSLKSHQLNVSIAVDTSGSISQKEISEFLSEITGLKSQIRARVTLIACDSEITGTPTVFEPWEEITHDAQLKGGGGTNFVPVFDWITEQDRQPDLLIYFTDAEGRFPELEPGYPVIWLLKGKEQPPWGQRIQLN